MNLRDWAKRLKRDIHAVWLAARDPRTPTLARWLAVGVAAYAVSPIDLIPDFIPVLGYLDDLILVPLGLWMALRLIPDEVLTECRQRAESAAKRPVSYPAAVAVVLVWALLAVLAWRYLG